MNGRGREEPGGLKCLLPRREFADRDTVNSETSEVKPACAAFQIAFGLARWLTEAPVLVGLGRPGPFTQGRVCVLLAGQRESLGQAVPDSDRCVAVRVSTFTPVSHTSKPFNCLFPLSGTSLIAQLVKNPPAVQETWVRSLGWEDPLEKGKATHSSVLAWRIPWTVSSVGLQRVGHNSATFTFTLSPFLNRSLDKYFPGSISYKMFCVLRSFLSFNKLFSPNHFQLNIQNNSRFTE